MSKVPGPLRNRRRVRRSYPVVAAAAGIFAAGFSMVSGAGAAAAGATYVALGDSYTSGPRSQLNPAPPAVATAPTTTSQVMSRLPSGSP